MAPIDARLRGKVIIVAGAGGIGDQLARRYALEEGSIVVGDIDVAAATRVAEEIRDRGGRAIGTELDGSDEKSIAHTVALATGKFGGLDGLHVNFAGFRLGDNEDILGLPIEDYDEIMRVDARGYVLCTRHALPPMLARGGGSIIYTSSDAAYLGEPIRLSYAMSKQALHALMRHVARRFGPQGVRANVIAPGLIWHSKLEALMTPEMIAGFKEATLLKTRLGVPDDIAALGALLLADEGSFITGQVINVNGGTVTRP
jgi:NAD(P)-dependent dehydrogenase (short-subunit alcohol dehydrogenase family)